MGPDRSSHRRFSVLRNFTKFPGKHLYQSLFFNKVAVLRSAILLKKRPWHRCFPWSFAIFIRKLFLQNTSGRLLLPWWIQTKLSLIFLWKVAWGLWTSITQVSFLWNYGLGRSKHCIRFSCEKMTISKSSRLQMLFKIDVLKNFALFTGKNLCWSLSLTKLLDRRHATLLKRGSNTGAFP